MTDINTSAQDGREAGAVEQLARDDVERKRFLKMAGKGVGGAAIATSLGAFIAACGSSSGGSSGSTGAAAATGSTTATTTMSASSTAMSTDLQIVNYALTLEYLESEFYAKVGASGLFKGSTLKTLKLFGGEESEHVVALHKVAMSLGKPAAKPTGKFPIKSASQVAKLAASVENLGAAAYLGQAARIKSKEVLAAALSIHSIEARHAATLNLLTKQDPTPNGAFAKPMTMAQVLKVVKPFIA
ncbi:MAG TPA: ferritin-like domain-containing protein [Solirubrobacteraceae bacterium]|nr:ferritin-like domain-containing protein [Solirubrobacteraceae bacterium]